MEEHFAVNRARWDEVVAIHRNSPFYGTRRFLAGGDVLSPIERGEIGDIAGRRLVHLQCHFGLDTLCLARRGAVVTGLDFSARAVAAARELAAEAGIAARFVESNVYDAAAALGGERFDLVYVTWGAINWLPDIAGWARVVASLLAPGGFLYLLEGHPAALVLDQKTADGPIVAAFDYFQGPAPLVFHEAKTYTGDDAPLTNTETRVWIHGLGAILGALAAAGMRLEFLHDHDALAWPLFPCMTMGADGLYRLPAGRSNLPLSFSLKAAKER